MQRRAAALGGWFVLVAVLLAAPARAQSPRPPRNGGSVTLGAGFRGLGDGAGPGGGGRFAWHIDPDWSLGIELGATRADVTVAAEPLEAFVGDLGLSLAWHPVVLGPAVPYVIAGSGWHLVGVEGGDGYREGGTTGFFAGGGVWVGVGKRLGFFVEDRWRWASIGVAVDGRDEDMNIGGNTIWGGLMVRFAPPRRPGF